MVFQHYTLYPWMTVQENTEFGLKLQGISKRQRREQASYYLEVVRLSEFAKALPKELSGGMKQRVAIARALTSNPKVLLMDEPVFLDYRDELMDLLRGREAAAVA